MKMRVVAHALKKYRGDSSRRPHVTSCARYNRAMFHAILLAATMNVAPDIEQRLAKFRPVAMTFAADQFTARERHLIDELVAASRDLENILWRQNSPEDIALYNSLPAGPLKHLMWING